MFRDMLHSTKRTGFSYAGIYHFFIIDEIASRAGFGPLAVLKRPLALRTIFNLQFENMWFEETCNNLILG